MAAGFAVIVDATFLQRAGRSRFSRLAQRLRVPYVIIDCVAPQDEVQRRLQQRDRQGNDASEAGVAVMLGQLARAEPLTAREQACRVEANSTEGADELWARLAQGLRRPAPAD